MSNLVQTLRAAHACPETMAKAREALAIVQEYCDTPKMPGAQTLTRLAHRIYLGMNAQDAAAREYAYRWHLPLDQWANHAEARGTRGAALGRIGKARAASLPVTGAWPVPHCIGM